MRLTLRIWRQKDPSVTGKMVSYQLDDVSATFRLVTGFAAAAGAG